MPPMLEKRNHRWHRKTNSKKHFQKQFENVFEQYPVIFKSEMEEVYKTMHDLKKTVKELQTKLAMQNAASVELFEEGAGVKAKKK